MSGVRFYSVVDTSGYGLASVAYVRGLRNAGVPVHWRPMQRQGPAMALLEPGVPPPLLALADDAANADLAELLRATSRPLKADAVLVHAAPEHWAAGFEPACRNVGMTGCEADRPPPHWADALEQAHAICVPGEPSRQALAEAGVRAPLHLVPQIRPGVAEEIGAAELADFRERLGIARDHFVFLGGGSWEPRKALPELLRAFAQAFEAGDPVTLVLKTAPLGHGAAPEYPLQPSVALAAAALESIERELGRALPSICLLPYELSGRAMTMLRSIADCHVSLSHGEAWGRDAFEAACRGTPLLMTGWGGPLDYLGAGWSGALPCRMREVPVFPPQCPVFWPPQRWAVADAGAAVAALRAMLRDPAPARAEAARICEALGSRYDEPQVTRQLLAALFG